jgi:ABC-2 type transport system permease protein
VELAPALVLARRAFRDARTRTIVFGYLFALYAYVQPAGYRHAYPTLADRIAFAHSFAANDALRLFYGYPYDVATVSGYSAWRVGGTLAIAAAAFGVLAAVRALRAEEEAGRMELILAGCVGRGTAYRSALGAIAAGTLLLWLAELAGFLVGGLPAGGSAYLALATASVVPVFVGLGAVASQLAPTQRVALELGAATVGLFLLLRVVADTSSGAGWLRWATPLGWAEELRPFTGARPLVLLLPATATALLLLVAARVAAGRDIGTGVLPARDTAEPRLRLLSSATAQALRAERGSLIAWAGGVGVFALILGMVSASISSAGISKSVRAEIAKLGSGSITTPSGYLAFVFIFFILAVSLFVCAQISAARHEEAEQRLETLLALPIGRERWLAGRFVLAASGAAAVSLVAGVLTWAGAASQGVGVSLPRMLEAGVNCLPVALLFLGIAALAYALLPRASAGIAYGLVTATFLWQLVGSLLGVPKWLVELTPFAHVGLVPAQPFRGSPAAIMVAIALAGALMALWVFRRRDLTGP